MEWPEKMEGDVALATLHTQDQADHTLPHNVAQSVPLVRQRKQCLMSCLICHLPLSCEKERPH